MTICECPQCGAATSPSDRKCGYCKAEFFVSSIAYLSRFDLNGIKKYLGHYKQLTKVNPDNAEGFLGLGLCHLQMKTYPLAHKCFDNFIDISPDVSQAYYYSVLAKIGGRRIMSLSLTEVKQYEQYINSAIHIDPEIPQYKLLLAMLKRDYYERNGMKVVPPNSTDMLSEIRGFEIARYEIDQINSAVKTANNDQYFGIFTIT